MAYSRDDGEVLRKVVGEDSRDPAGGSVLDLAELVAVEGLVQDVVDDLVGGLHRVLPPGLAVVRPQDDDLSLGAAQGGEVRHLDDDGAAEDGDAFQRLSEAAAAAAPPGLLTLKIWHPRDPIPAPDSPGPLPPSEAGDG